ncbi:MAG: hypothetical protein ABIT20_18635 [Gemmatimonadaceae bacterium]
MSVSVQLPASSTSELELKLGLEPELEMLNAGGPRSGSLLQLKALPTLGMA